MESIRPKELKKMIDAGEDLTLIDVREDFERDGGHIGGKHIPMGEILNRADEFPVSGKVIVYCRSGNRSGQAITYLSQQKGYKNLINLEGGMLAYRDEVDSSLNVV